MFYKVVDAKGKSYTASENFTDPFAPAMIAAGLTTDDVKFDRTVQRNLKVEKRPHSQSLATAYGICVVRNKTTNKVVLSVYSSESKETVVKAAKHDKSSIRNFASVAKRGKGNC